MLKCVPRTSTSASFIRTLKGLPALLVTSKKASPDNSTTRSEPVKTAGYFKIEAAFNQTLLPSANTNSFCLPPTGFSIVCDNTGGGGFRTPPTELFSTEARCVYKIAPADNKT